MLTIKVHQKFPFTTFTKARIQFQFLAQSSCNNPSMTTGKYLNYINKSP